jgi:hypothetical protein
MSEGDDLPAEVLAGHPIDRLGLGALQSSEVRARGVAGIDHYETPTRAAPAATYGGDGLGFASSAPHKEGGNQ